MPILAILCYLEILVALCTSILCYWIHFIDKYRLKKYQKLKEKKSQLGIRTLDLSIRRQTLYCLSYFSKKYLAKNSSVFEEITHFTETKVQKSIFLKGPSMKYFKISQDGFSSTYINTQKTNLECARQFGLP